jgi:uncharacterized membrane protein YwaF
MELQIIIIIIIIIITQAVFFVNLWIVCIHKSHIAVLVWDIQTDAHIAAMMNL